MSPRTTEPTKIVVFASGRGSNFRALCEAINAKKLNAVVQALVTNVCGVGACDVARSFNVPVLEVPHLGLKRAEHEARLLRALEDVSFDWIVLAGYMRLFTEEFVKRYRIVNIHPSLLPSFPGKDGYAQALRHGVKVTGVTVHLVGSGLDDGPIVAQRALDIRDTDDEARLSERGLKLEHELYPETLERLFHEKWSVVPGTETQGRPRVVFERGRA